MKRLLIYLKEYKKECVLAPLFKLLEAFFELMVPLVMASIIDRGIADRDMGYIGKLGLCLLGLGLVGLVSAITAQYFAARAAVGFSTKVRQALFDHIQDLSFTNIDKVGTSTMITRMTSDINQVQSGVNMVLRLFLRSPIIVFGATIMAFTIDVKSALVFVVAIPLLAVVVFGIMMVTIPLYGKVQSVLDKVLGITRENLTGARVIRAFSQEEEEEERFRENHTSLVSLQMFVGKISACMNPLTYVIVNGAIISLIYVGAIQVNVGDLVLRVGIHRDHVQDLQLVLGDLLTGCCSGRIGHIVDPALFRQSDPAGHTVQGHRGVGNDGVILHRRHIQRPFHLHSHFNGIQHGEDLAVFHHQTHSVHTVDPVDHFLIRGGVLHQLSVVGKADMVQSVSLRLSGRKLGIRLQRIQRFINIPIKLGIICNRPGFRRSRSAAKQSHCDKNPHRNKNCAQSSQDPP